MNYTLENDKENRFFLKHEIETNFISLEEAGTKYWGSNFADGKTWNCTGKELGLSGDTDAPPVRVSLCLLPALEP